MPRLVDALAAGRAPPREPWHVGVLPGEGIGPEVVPAALEVLRAVAAAGGRRVELRTGGDIGNDARKRSGRGFTEEIADFCTQTWADGGALFCGPGGARFVYDLRERFDLFCKFTPLAPVPALDDCGALRPDVLKGVDIVAVRENIGGLYFGRWGRDGDRAFHEFDYRAAQVARILQVAVRLARARSGRLCLIIKREGIPAISELWLEQLEAATAGQGLAVDVLDIDNAVYQLVVNPRRFDVFVSSNMFGDVLADTGSALLASRGMSYSGNYSPDGKSSYQTGHGAAYDITGRGCSNPCGQILATAMMLEETFGWSEGAAAIRGAVAAALGEGLRTPDIAAPGRPTVGTRALGARIAQLAAAAVEQARAARTAAR